MSGKKIKRYTMFSGLDSSIISLERDVDPDEGDWCKSSEVSDLESQLQKVTAERDRLRDLLERYHDYMEGVLNE